VTGPEIPASADPLAALRTGSWLDEQCFPPLRYAVPGIIPEGSTLLVGAPKIGKSWLVLSCALAKAIGGRGPRAVPGHPGPNPRGRQRSLERRRSPNTPSTPSPSSTWRANEGERLAELPYGIQKRIRNGRMKALVLNYWDTSRKEFRSLVDVIHTDGERSPGGAARGSSELATATWVNAILQDLEVKPEDVTIVTCGELVRPSFAQVRTAAAFLMAQGA